MVDGTMGAAAGAERLGGLRKDLKLQAGMVVCFANPVSFAINVGPALPLPEPCTIVHSYLCFDARVWQHFPQGVLMT